MKVLIAELGEIPYEKNIDNDLKSWQKIVRDYIQVTIPYVNLVGIVCNDEGKIIGLPLNKYVPESEIKETN